MPLPGARGAFYQWCTATCLNMRVHVLDLRTGKQRILLENAAAAWYLPSGYLLYVRRDGVGLVAPFDLERLEVTGPGVPVLERVQVNPGGYALLAWSQSGSLAYVMGSGRSSDDIVVRVKRDGDASAIDSTWHGQFNALALSPDGRRVAVGVGVPNGTGGNVWIKQLDHGPFTRLTFGAADRRPIWSPDGRTVAFLRDSGATTMLYARPADGSGEDRLVARLDRQIQEALWSHDGQWLILRTDNATPGAGDLVGVRLRGDSTPVPLVATPFTELHPALSPDGRWLAYTSNESGINEVYVRPFLNSAGGRWQISNGGGSEPRWSPKGNELFFLDRSPWLNAAQVQTAPTFAVSEVRPLFDASQFSSDPFHQSYDVTPDGSAFIFGSPRQQGARASGFRLVWVDNWFSDLQARVKQ